MSQRQNPVTPEITWVAEIHDHNLPGPNRDEVTTGTEQLIEEKYRTIYPDIYFEEQPNGKIFIFRSKAEARSVKNNIGTVYPAS